ncbi:MAG: hypothetical protein K2X08_01915 [Chlamydiales bacterium]|nr:hypothetical protein [Chlamydiales bacterium]
MEEYNWEPAEREAYIKANIALADEFDARRREREEGRKEGRREEQQALARKLLKRGVPLKEIIEDLSLGEEELKQLL